jgi:hypothetical protein
VYSTVIHEQMMKMHLAQKTIFSDPSIIISSVFLQPRLIPEPKKIIRYAWNNQSKRLSIIIQPFKSDKKRTVIIDFNFTQLSIKKQFTFRKQLKQSSFITKIKNALVS